MAGNWIYLTPEQGAILESFCDEFWDGPSGEGCKLCPLRAVCEDDSISDLSEPQRTKVFEERMWEQAVKATS